MKVFQMGSQELESCNRDGSWAKIHKEMKTKTQANRSRSIKKSKREAGIKTGTPKAEVNHSSIA